MTTNTELCLATVSSPSRMLHVTGFAAPWNATPPHARTNVICGAECREDEGISSGLHGGLESVRPERSPKQILCVENDREACQAIARVLASYTVAWARSMGDARELYRHQRFSLILIADLLPDGNGLELCEEIRSEDYLTPIIIMTRNPEMSEIASRIAGAQRLLKKHQTDYLKELRALADYLSV